MSLKLLKKSDLDKSWMKARRDKPKKIKPEYHLSPALTIVAELCLHSDMASV